MRCLRAVLVVALSVVGLLLSAPSLQTPATAGVVEGESRGETQAARGREAETEADRREGGASGGAASATSSSTAVIEPTATPQVAMHPQLTLREQGGAGDRDSDAPTEKERGNEEDEDANDLGDRSAGGAAAASVTTRRAAFRQSRQVIDVSLRQDDLGPMREWRRPEPADPSGLETGIDTLDPATAAKIDAKISELKAAGQALGDAVERAYGTRLGIGPLGSERARGAVLRASGTDITADWGLPLGAAEFFIEDYRTGGDARVEQIRSSEILARLNSGSGPIPDLWRALGNETRRLQDIKSLLRDRAGPGSGGRFGELIGEVSRQINAVSEHRWALFGNLVNLAEAFEAQLVGLDVLGLDLDQWQDSVRRESGDTENPFRMNNTPEAINGRVMIGGQDLGVLESIQYFQQTERRLREWERSFEVKQEHIGANPTIAERQALETQRADLAAWRRYQNSIVAALTGELRDAAEFLEAHPEIDIDIDTREILGTVNHSFLGLQAELANRDDPRLNVIYKSDPTYTGRLLSWFAGYRGGAGAYRFQVVTTNGTVHHVATDAYLDRTNRRASLIVMDSTGLGIAEIVEGLPQPFLRDYRVIVTHYATQEQALCSGCRQFSLEFARRMAAFDDLHAEPLRRLESEAQERLVIDTVGKVGKVGGNRDSSWRNQERLGELPPALFEQTNSRTVLGIYVEARRAFLDRIGADASDYAALLSLKQRVDAHRTERKVPDTADRTTRINLEVDRLRAGGIRALADAFQRGNGAQLLMSLDEQRFRISRRSIEPGNRAFLALQRRADERALSGGGSATTVLD